MDLVLDCDEDSIAAMTAYLATADTITLYPDQARRTPQSTFLDQDVQEMKGAAVALKAISVAVGVQSFSSFKFNYKA